MKLTCLFITLLLTGMTIIHAVPATCQDKQKAEWEGILSNGFIITRQNLKEIIDEHQKYLNDRPKKNKEKGANLRNDILFGAVLIDADLSGANLGEADLNKSMLFRANLRGADLSKSMLFRANLRGANLSKAILFRANLEEANLTETELFKADLNDAIFQPDFLPPIRKIAFALNLSKMKYKNSRQALTELREGFKKAGLRKQEREVTYAIKHTQRKKLWNDNDSSIPNKIESIFYLVFFEWTCAYGMAPGRLFLVLIGFIFIFTIPYSESISRDNKDGIWKVWISDRMRKDLGEIEPVRLYALGLPSLKMGFYFSILSAFSIGWRELNVGNWIARMQKYEYTLRATGWVRTISGLQSLISVYLFALWVLTFFGRPFEAF